MSRLHRSILLVTLAWCLSVLLSAVPNSASAANFQTASVLVDTDANILAKTGLYVGQQAIATDHNGATRRWSGTAWMWDTRCQIVSAIRTTVTAPADTATNALHQYALPRLGTKDSVRVYGLLRFTEANSKTFAVKVGTVGSMSDGWAPSAYTQTGQLHFYTEMTNTDNAATQTWMSNQDTTWGRFAAAPNTTTKDTGVAGKLIQVTVAKTTAGDSVTLLKSTIEICGGGAP